MSTPMVVEFPGFEKSSDATNGNYPSRKIWSLYNFEAEKQDRSLVYRWKSDMDAILIFAGLFSAIVTAFIIEGYKYLQPDPDDVMVAFLAQISGQLSSLANLTSNSPAPVVNSFTQAPFVPPGFAIVYNILWLMSLMFSLTCALAATLVQQWARDYLHEIAQGTAPLRRASIRTFLYEGIRTFHMADVVDGIPMLLHLSLFLFATGLVVFFVSVNEAIGYTILGLVITVGCFYLVITTLPAFFLHCPFRTPFTRSFWHTALFLHRIKPYLRSLRSIRMHSGTDVRRRSRRPSLNATQAREIGAMEGNRRRLTGALKWMVESLSDDNEFERLVEAIPEFVSTGKAEARAIRVLLRDTNLSNRITQLLRTCRGSLLPVPTKQRRAVICLTAIWSLIVEPDLFDVPPNAPVVDINQFIPGYFLVTLQLLNKDNHLQLIGYTTSITAVLFCNWLRAVAQMICGHPRDVQQCFRESFQQEMRNRLGLSFDEYVSQPMPISEGQELLAALEALSTGGMKDFLTNLARIHELNRVLYACEAYIRSAPLNDLENLLPDIARILSSVRCIYATECIGHFVANSDDLYEPANTIRFLITWLPMNSIHPSGQLQLASILNHSMKKFSHADTESQRRPAIVDSLLGVLPMLATPAALLQVKASLMTYVGHFPHNSRAKDTLLSVSSRLRDLNAVDMTVVNTDDATSTCDHTIDEAVPYCSTLDMHRVVADIN